jgi:rhomboid protease GluP
VLTDVWREGKFSAVISLQTLNLYGANNSTSVIYNHQYYRLITAMFLHAGFIHVFFNSFTIVMYLMRFEPCVSRLHFMLIVGVGGM